MDSSVSPPGADNVNGMACTGGVWLRRSASLGLGNGRQMLGEKPDDFRVVYTNFQCDFLSGFALIKQGEDVILSGEGPIPVRPGSVSTGINPMRRGPASLEGPPSLLSQRPKRSL